MSKMSEAARAAAKKKAERLVSVGKGQMVSSADWKPEAPLNASRKTGLKPITPSNFGGSTSDADDNPRPRADRIARASGGRTKGKTNIAIVINAGKGSSDQNGGDKPPASMIRPPAPPPPMAPPPMGAPPMMRKFGGRLPDDDSQKGKFDYKPSDIPPPLMDYFSGDNSSGGGFSPVGSFPQGGLPMPPMSQMSQMGNFPQGGFPQGGPPPMPPMNNFPQGGPQMPQMGNFPQGGPPMPQMPPLPMGGFPEGGPPPMPPMMRKAGGRIPHMTAGAGSGEGRLEKTAMQKKDRQAGK